MANPEGARTPGQMAYEQWCRDEWENPPYYCWNSWDGLPSEWKTEWERAAVTGLGNPERMMRDASH
jgi:hypothetical protein